MVEAENVDVVEWKTDIYELPWTTHTWESKVIYNAWSFFFLIFFLPKPIYCPSPGGSQCQIDIMIAFLCHERENNLLHAFLTLLIIICAKQALKEK